VANRDGSVVLTDLKKLNQFVKELSATCRDYEVRIGIFGNKAQRKKGEVTNPELGAIHEFGLGRVPKRSFLRMPLELKSDAIMAQVKSSDNWKNLEHGKPLPVLRDLGHACEAIIETAFDTRGYGTWQPDLTATVDAKTRRLSPAQRKKVGGYSNSPLIDTGQLRRSVTSMVVKNSE
jgi:phage gpG-like protein